MLREVLVDYKLFEQKHPLYSVVVKSIMLLSILLNIIFTAYFLYQSYQYANTNRAFIPKVLRQLEESIQRDTTKISKTFDTVTQQLEEKSKLLEVQFEQTIQHLHALKKNLENTPSNSTEIVLSETIPERLLPSKIELEENKNKESQEKWKLSNLNPFKNKQENTA